MDIQKYVEESEGLVQKHKDILLEESAPAITSPYMAAQIAEMIEHQKRSNRESAAQFGQVIVESTANEDASVTNTGNIATWDPVLVAMVRRAAPVLLAFDWAGVQTLKMPSGLVFSIRSRMTDKNGKEILFDSVDTAFTGRKPTNTEQGMVGTENGATIDTGLANEDPFSGLYLRGVGMNTPDAEGDVEPEVTFTIDRIHVEARERQLRGSHSIELEQDLRNVHDLSAQNELTNVMSGELLFEQNREFVRLLYTVARLGAQQCATPGIYDIDVDADGRWAVEKFKGLIFQIMLEANKIGLDTRRGLGNKIICSPNVAAMLYMAGVLDTGGSNSLAAEMGNADFTKSTYVGRLLGRFDVHVDPYTNIVDAVCIGYAGPNAWDRGIYYCPYTPLQLYKATDPKSFHPQYAYKTRYGLVSNPFVTVSNGGAQDAMTMTPARNQYFRKFKVEGIYGA